MPAPWKSGLDFWSSKLGNTRTTRTGVPAPFTGPLSAKSSPPRPRQRSPKGRLPASVPAPRTPWLLPPPSPRPLAVARLHGGAAAKGWEFVRLFRVWAGRNFTVAEW